MKRMLFNATHAEELRVAIVEGQKLIDLDIESVRQEERKSNIYKAVISSMGSSVEACFVDYGESRNGFLPFKEIAKSNFIKDVDLKTAKITDVVKEGQELLIQVEKDERGNKGAAMTSFISLAGRYLVLMPNNPRGGGVSRRIEGDDRQEIREALDQLQVPAGMSVIARTAGIGRAVEELQWDLNYLLQLWSAIESAAQVQKAPFLIYQESSLVIRAIRDYFRNDIMELLIDDEAVFEQAHQFMSHVMPDFANRVKLYKDKMPLFSRFQIEQQIETAHSRVVNLPSGGSIVIDHTEALVAIDVNSAKATRGLDIEETAYNTNLEAAEEAARQLRLRDLGGLIVIDFIDMENQKNQRVVEQKLKDSLADDRARVQMGKISRFGLMELSRQRLRASLSEGAHVSCPRCNGVGMIRDISSTALHVLRVIQEEASKESTAQVYVQLPIDVATFLLNEKRFDLANIERVYQVNIVVIPNKYLENPNYRLNRVRHDEVDVNQKIASYLRVEDVSEQANLQAQDKNNNNQSKQKPVVSGIVPTDPAPNRKKEGIFQKMWGWLISAKALQPQKTTRTTRPAQQSMSGAGRQHDHRSEMRSSGKSSGAANSRGDVRGDRNEPRSEQRFDRNSKRDRPSVDKSPVVETNNTANLANAPSSTPDRGDRQDRPDRNRRRSDRKPNTNAANANGRGEERSTQRVPAAQDNNKQAMAPKVVESVDVGGAVDLTNPQLAQTNIPKAKSQNEGADFVVSKEVSLIHSLQQMDADDLLSKIAAGSPVQSSHGQEDVSSSVSTKLSSANETVRAPAVVPEPIPVFDLDTMLKDAEKAGLTMVQTKSVATIASDQMTDQTNSNASTTEHARLPRRRSHRRGKGGESGGAQKEDALVIIETKATPADVNKELG